jgi:hypothetical protein
MLVEGAGANDIARQQNFASKPIAADASHFIQSGAPIQFRRNF